MRNDEQLALLFKALGEPTRLKIFLSLMQCCRPVALEENGDIRPVNGLTVGEVCCQIVGEEKITSTLSAHLKELRLAGLITMEKQGRHVICSVNWEMVAQIRQFWQNQDCC